MEVTKGPILIDECIHGLDRARCDTCSPAPVPVVLAAPPRSSTSRTATATVPRRAAVRKTAPPLDDVGEQRVYHLTHISNLPSIVAAGAIFADAALPERPTVDISSEANREARRVAAVDGLTGGSDDETSNRVSAFVPLSLSPDATFWTSIRAGKADKRLAKDAKSHPAGDYVMLVSTVRSIRLDARGSDKQVVLADGDAAAPLTRFASEADVFERLLRKLRADEDAVPREGAELLVSESLSFDLISLIGVANDRARASVKALLDESGYEARVAVYPPWYAPPSLVE
ncbi:MAG: hypothetical protein JWQ12_2140 [Glaciihabitans sp.]|nr:hypothetical protein [Glaciihabitans sp.]